MFGDKIWMQMKSKLGLLCRRCVPCASRSSVPSIWKYEFPFHYSYMPCISIRCRFGIIYFFLPCSGILSLLAGFAFAWLSVRLITVAGYFVMQYSLVEMSRAQHTRLIFNATHGKTNQIEYAEWNSIYNIWLIYSEHDKYKIIIKNEFRNCFDSFFSFCAVSCQYFIFFFFWL